LISWRSFGMIVWEIPALDFHHQHQ
jgi:hypothetical protein